MSFEAKIERAENQRLLAFLRQRRGDKPLYAPPSSHPDPYMGCGCHPDVVARLWDQLGKGLTVDGRALIFQHPALVHAENGTIVGLCLGTQYALRLRPALEQQARMLGLQPVMKWSSGELLDVEEQWGKGWLWGGWKKEEKEWMVAWSEVGLGGEGHP